MRFLVLLLYLWSTTAAAIECSFRADRTPGEQWRYRVIEGKACWYRGSAALPKSNLQWEAPEPTALEPITATEPTETEVVFTLPSDIPMIVKTISIRPEPPPQSIDRYASLIIVFFLILAFAIAMSVLLMCARSKHDAKPE